jgi:3-phenylpropionate/trans-cinnamate dioxygenase ferredoxin subunit
MNDYKPVAKTKDFQDGVIKGFRIDGADIAVVRYNERYYAFLNACTHNNYYFNYLEIQEGGIIPCDGHGAAFELESGHVVRGPAARDLPIYEVRVEGDDVLVSWEKKA